MPIKFYTPEFYVFNNFSAHAIEFRGKLYPTSEHAYQAAKCTDPRGQEAIRNARSPLQAKVLAKLAQHPEAQEALRKSGHEDIVEDSPTDYFWGEGADGSGQNMLGKLWMKIREEK